MHKRKTVVGIIASPNLRGFTVIIYLFSGTDIHELLVVVVVTLSIHNH
jgi:hypothetical protein